MRHARRPAHPDRDCNDIALAVATALPERASVLAHTSVYRRRGLADDGVERRRLRGRRRGAGGPSQKRCSTRCPANGAVSVGGVEPCRLAPPSSRRALDVGVRACRGVAAGRGGCCSAHCTSRRYVPPMRIFSSASNSWPRSATGSATRRRRTPRRAGRRLVSGKLGSRSRSMPPAT